MTPVTVPIPHHIPGWIRCLGFGHGAPKASIDSNGLCINCDERATDEQKGLFKSYREAATV